MNTQDLSGFTKCYGAYDGNTIIAFMAVMTFPHPIRKNTKRCSRLVVLPDYQGIGIGRSFLNTIAEMYKKQGYSFLIMTSAKNMIWALNKDKHWKMTRLGFCKGQSITGTLNNKTKSDRNNAKTASFEYRG